MTRLSVLLLLVGCGGKWTPSDADGDGVSWYDGDCDDADPNIGPHVAEIWYDGVDSDCDGWDDYDADRDGFVSIDHGGNDCHDDNNEAFPGWVEIWYDCYDNDCSGNDGDQDGDGFVPAEYAASCERWTELNPGLRTGDCWDDPDEPFDADYVGSEANRPTPPEVNPDASDAWYDGVDTNCDGASDFDADGDGFDREDECDDTDPDVFPNDADQVWYNCVDEDCSGNDGDQDGDGYLDADYPSLCSNWSALNPGLATGDCDDEDAAINPDASDAPVDGVDQDCDGDDHCYVDSDGDGYGGDDTTAGVGLDCDRPSRGISDNSEDCDDDDAWAYPGAAANESATACTRDRDGDGWGDDSPSGEVSPGLDCDDTDSAVSPDATEGVADGVDQDCDGDELCYADADGDGYGSTTTTQGSGLSCDQPSAGLADDTDDCDDGDSAISPGGDETIDCFDGVDQDCDLYVEEGCYSGGELVVTEVFYNEGGEHAWFEVVNVSGGEVDLYGFVLEMYYFNYAWDSFTVDSSLPLRDEDRAVFCYDASLGHTAGICDFEYGDLASNFELEDDGYSEIVVWDQQSVRLDALDYDVQGDWPNLVRSQESSIELCEDPPTESGNDDGANWAEVDTTDSRALYYSTNGSYYGTPGAENTCN